MPAATAPAPARIPAKDGRRVGFAAALEAEAEDGAEDLEEGLAEVDEVPDGAPELLPDTEGEADDGELEPLDGEAAAALGLAPETALVESWDMPPCEELLWAAAMATRERMTRESFILK